MTDKSNAEVARTCANELFRNGAGTEASRLVLMVEHPNAPPLNIGGWCKESVANRIEPALATTQSNLARQVLDVVAKVKITNLHGQPRPAAYVMESVNSGLRDLFSRLEIEVDEGGE